MKTFSFIALILLLCGCTTTHHDSTEDVKQFYLAWMSAYTQNRDTSALMQRYVAKDVINRLAMIDTLYEQEILDADYFMYVQDYAPEWIPQLRVGQARPFLGGEKVDVQLGTESAPVWLEVYTRRRTVAGKFIASRMQAVISNTRSTAPEILRGPKHGLLKSPRNTKK